MAPCLFTSLSCGINVGGRNSVAMADLREMVDGMGFTGAKTLLQSGNLVFTAASKSASALEKQLEQETEKRFGVAADYVIRSAKELAQVVAANPFPKEAKADPSHLVVMFLKSATSAQRGASLTGGDQRPRDRPRGRQAPLPCLPRRHRRIETDQRHHREKDRHARHGPQLEHDAQAGGLAGQSEK